MIANGAFVFTDPASNAKFCVDIGTFQPLGAAVAHLYFNGLKPDRLGRGRTDFFANDTFSMHCPRQASSPVVKGRADLDRLLLCWFSQLFLDGQRRNRSGGAYMAAEHAVIFTISDSVYEDRCPYALKPGLEQCRLNGIGGACLHALTAFQAAPEKIAFSDGTGWPDDVITGRSLRGYGALHYRETDGPNEGALYQSATTDVEGQVFSAGGFGKAVMDCVFRTVHDAVHAEVAFGNPECSMGVTAPVAVTKTFFAVSASVHIPPYSHQRTVRKDSKEGSQGAERTTPETGKEPVRKDYREENQAEERAAVKEGLFEIDSPAEVIECGKNRDGERSRDERNRIQQARLKGPECSQDNNGREQVIFETVKGSIRIELDRIDCS